MQTLSLNDSRTLPPAAGASGSLLEIRIATLAFLIMAVTVGSDMLAGPLRYYLSKVGIDFLIYLPKAAALAFALHELVRRPLPRHLFHLILFLLFFSAVGLMHGVRTTSQLFTLYQISPFLFGAVAARFLGETEDSVVRLMVLTLVITAVGVYLNYFKDFPWVGFTYSVGGAEIEGSREWSTMGFKRIAGFTRMSAAAAFYLDCSALFLYCYLRSRFLKLLLFVAVFPAVLLTTNKAGIGGLFLGVAVLALCRWRRLQSALIYAVTAATALLPISCLFRSYNFDLADPGSLLLLASFEDRLTNTWPQFFALVRSFGDGVTGVGFGGVGSALKYFAGGGRAGLSVADNFALYLYGCFGIGAILVLWYFARITTRLFAAGDRLSRALAAAMAACLGAALTTDVIEAQAFALILGVAAGYAGTLPRRRARRRGMSKPAAQCAVPATGGATVTESEGGVCAGTV